MKKILLIIVLGFLLVIFSKVIFSQIIIFSLSKLVERETFVSKVDINYSKREIVFNLIEIRNMDKFYYKNIFEADKIKIFFDTKSLFSELIVIKNLNIINPEFFLDIRIVKDSQNFGKEKTVYDDNIGLAKKIN